MARIVGFVAPSAGRCRLFLGVRIDLYIRAIAFLDSYAADERRLKGDMKFRVVMDMNSLKELLA